ncbi:MAG: GNAT family N-acetyltransferase [Clostridiaceae bacterium]
MFCLNKEDMYKIVQIFHSFNETMIWSCLQGYMGKAFVDDVQQPKSAQIIIGDFCFFAGIPNLDLVKNIPEYYVSQSILMIPSSEEWEKLIEQEYEENYHKFIRYAFRKEKGIFNKERLNSFVKKLPTEYHLQKISKEIFHSIKREQWSKDLCSQFSNYLQYEKMGIGFVIMDNSEIVCGASSYTVYDGGIEIEIDTKEEYRRKGFATVCASKLILECISRGIYPSWDAANKKSASLAEKLGYNLENEYITYAINTFR